MVLVRVPVVAAADACTGTVIVQLPSAGMELPVPSVMLVAPGAALRIPPQVVLAAGDAATVNCGLAPSVVRASVNAVIVAATAAEFVSVIVSVLTPPCRIVPGANTLLPPTLDVALTTRAPDADENATPPK